MFLIIDAYNILKQVISLKEITRVQRERFIQLVFTYARRKNHYAVIVFDGGADRWPSTEKKKQGSITFAGTTISADDYIKTFISDNKDKDMLLISTDRALATWASKYRVPAIDALDFYQFLKNELSNEVERKKNLVLPVKITEDENPELDRLMTQASETIYPKQEEKQADRKSSGQHQSKKERKILQKIKKL
ncbi:MAG: NYN domain-containing protein [Candidatus Dependentiae bacterium]